MPVRAPTIAVHEQHSVMYSILSGEYLLIFGGSLLAIGIAIIAVTLYGTQRTTAQILTNQKAAIQNPKTGLKYGGMGAGVGGAMLALGLAMHFIHRKFVH